MKKKFGLIATIVAATTFNFSSALKANDEEIDHWSKEKIIEYAHWLEHAKEDLEETITLANEALVQGLQAAKMAISESFYDNTWEVVGALLWNTDYLSEAYGTTFDYHVENGITTEGDDLIHWIDQLGSKLSWYTENGGAGGGGGEWSEDEQAVWDAVWYYIDLYELEIDHEPGMTLADYIHCIGGALGWYIQNGGGHDCGELQADHDAHHDAEEAARAAAYEYIDKHNLQVGHGPDMSLADLIYCLGGALDWYILQHQNEGDADGWKKSYEELRMAHDTLLASHEELVRDHDAHHANEQSLHNQIASLQERIRQLEAGGGVSLEVALAGTTAILKNGEICIGQEVFVFEKSNNLRHFNPKEVKHFEIWVKEPADAERAFYRWRDGQKK